jgi:HAMP domain-containing protein
MAGIYSTFHSILAGESDGFLEVLSKNSERSQAKLVSFFEENARKIGENLVKKDSLILKSSFQENSISTVRSNLKNTFEFDNLVLIANFIVVEDQQIKAWQYLDRNHTGGLNLPIRYSEADRKWLSGNDSARVEVLDERALNIKDIKKLTIQRINFKSSVDPDVTLPAFEVITPIFDGKDDEIDQFLADGEAVGYLRYVISLEQLAKAIASEQNELQAALTSQKQSSAHTLSTAKNKVLLGVSLSLLLQFITGVVVVLIATGIAAYLAKILSKPIDELSKASESIAAGNYDTEIKVASKDEVGRLGQTFDSMRVQVKKFTLHLQDLVNERTSELNKALQSVTEKSQKIREIMARIDQGIFTIDRDQLVEKEYSRHLERLFPHLNSFAGQPYHQIVLPYSDLSDDRKEFIQAAVSNSIGLEDFSWIANVDQLPHRIHYRWQDSSESTYEINWTALTTDDIVERVLICMRDITEELRREELIRKQKEESSRIFDTISQIIRVPRKNFVLGMKDCVSRFKEIHQLPRADPHFKAIYIHLHTIKGVGRSMGFPKLTEAVHEVEHYIYLHVQSGSDVDVARFETALAVADEEFAFILKQARDTLKIDIEAHDHQLNNLCSALADPISDVLDLCRHANLPVDHVAVNDHVSDWPTELLAEFSQVARHAFSNTLDHGYLKPQARGKKPKKFVVEIDATETSDGIRITFKDNGHGFDRDAIRRKAEEAGLKYSSDAELLQLPLREGFSTADKVTELSGRGVGLSALKEFSLKVSGRLELADNEGGGSKIILLFPRPGLKLAAAAS